MDDREEREIELLREAGALVGKLLDFWGENKGPWTFGRKQHPWTMPGWKKEIYLNAVNTKHTKQERIEKW
ncbi:MAG: hypothetical protein K9K63_06105 [Desulfotignum sp.]|nr:hypothetical protein [Desulfotignum sp.]MCF8136868.1 hypothetical protein [Desulfotignum sp.]